MYHQLISEIERGRPQPLVPLEKWHLREKACRHWLCSEPRYERVHVDPFDGWVDE
jgi:hypothetical protein